MANCFGKSAMSITETEHVQLSPQHFFFLFLELEQQFWDAALLAEGGRAYIEVPHADYRFKTDVFPHTWFFTPAALQKLAARARVIEQRSEVFGRLPSSGALDLAWRAGFRVCAALGAATLGGWLDDRLWRYRAGADGIWLRWIVARPASHPG